MDVFFNIFGFFVSSSPRDNVSFVFAFFDTFLVLLLRPVPFTSLICCCCSWVSCCFLLLFLLVFAVMVVVEDIFFGIFDSVFFFRHLFRGQRYLLFGTLTATTSTHHLIGSIVVHGCLAVHCRCCCFLASFHPELFFSCVLSYYCLLVVLVSFLVFLLLLAFVVGIIISCIRFIIIVIAFLFSVMRRLFC